MTAFSDYMQQVYPNLVASVIWGPIVLLGTWILHSRLAVRVEKKVENAIQKRETTKVSMVEASPHSPQMVAGSQRDKSAPSSTQQTQNEAGKVDTWEPEAEEHPQSTR